MALVSCGSLKPVSVTRNGTLLGYKYAYINPTSMKISSESQPIYSNGTYLQYSETKSTNPSDIISGELIKKGFLIVHDITPDEASQTIVVNYAETGRRNLWYGYTTEIAIQILSASDNSLLCTGTAEGLGETEADDIRIAIRRCLKEIFK